MKLRLKRISKLNIVVAVFVSILLLFCSYVCPRLFVYASNSGVSKYLHGSQYVTKMGITLSNQIIYVVVIFALRLHLMSVLVIVLMLLECLYLLLIR